MIAIILFQSTEVTMALPVGGQVVITANSSGATIGQISNGSGGIVSNSGIVKGSTQVGGSIIFNGNITVEPIPSPKNPSNVLTVICKPTVSSHKNITKVDMEKLIPRIQTQTQMNTRDFVSNAITGQNNVQLHFLVNNTSMVQATSIITGDNGIIILR